MAGFDRRGRLLATIEGQQPASQRLAISRDGRQQRVGNRLFSLTDLTF
jgi:hypothetical protein